VFLDLSTPKVHIIAARAHTVATVHPPGRVSHHSRQPHLTASAPSLPPQHSTLGLSYQIVTPGFKIKTRCLSYVCLGSSFHTYDQNVNTENQCLYYINFITRILSLHRRLYQLSHQAVAEQSNPTGNRPGATQGSRRNLHHSSPSHFQVLSNVIARVKRLMVATQ
jgi:hypothetical protein